MSSQEILNLDLASTYVSDLEEKAYGKLANIGKSSQIVRDEVFKIIADNSNFLQYPIADDELCGFVCSKDKRLFSYINSYLPYEKQIFAAAHELYHIWFDNEISITGEILKSKNLDLFEITGNQDKEALANRFAAMFLVPKDVLRNQLNHMGLNENNLELKHLVKLMEIFHVPYKTIVRRLYEVEFIQREKCIELLQIPDRDEKSGVRLVQKRWQIGAQQQRRTKIIKFDGLVDDALYAFEQEMINEEKLQYLLSLVRKTVEEFMPQQEKDQMSEEEIISCLENE